MDQVKEDMMQEQDIMVKEETLEKDDEFVTPETLSLLAQLNSESTK